MRGFLLFICLFSLVICKKEKISDLYEMLNDPKFLLEIEKRINNLDDDNDPFSDGQVGCYDNSGLLPPACSFHANASTIIKTHESLQRGAQFLDDNVNVSCPRECTSLCCQNPQCDTAVYQNKGDRKCYLFKCGESSRCVFSHHSNYSMSSISKAAHTSHSYTPGGATHSHENELENLGSHDKQQDTTPALDSLKTTTEEVPPEIRLPELGEYCPSYMSRCADQHAECMEQSCQCRVGYHKRYDQCRKHCTDEQFECEKVYDVDSTQCLLNRYVCDGHRDCSDGSDEENCPAKNKPAYLDGDGNNNFYNNPFYNSQYSQPDSQFPYGFPIPGLTNQQQAGLYQPANQIYQVKGTANQNPAGQYFVPGLTNQNQGGVNLVPAGNQINQQWPLSSGIGSQVYQNNVAYPAGQQQNYIPAQSGFVQKPVRPVQQVNPNIQPVQQSVGQGIQQAQSNQVQGSAINQNPVPVPKVATSAPVVEPIAQKNKNTVKVNDVKSQDTGYLIDHLYDTVTEAEETDRSRNRYPFSRTSQNDHSVNSYDNENLDEDINKPTKTGMPDYPYPERMENDNAVNNDVGNRHSSDEDDNSYSRGRTYPSATKTKTQIVSPTQSTEAGRKQGQSHSEGFPDYSWLKYDDDSPRVSGKKGKTLNPSRVSDTNSESGRKQSGQAKVKSSTNKSLKVQDTKQENHDTEKIEVASDTKYNNNKIASDTKYNNNDKIASDTEYDNSDKFGNSKYNTDNRYPDDYRFQYNDYRRPSTNRRPSHDRYKNRNDNSRRRPSPGTRYPYYDTGYQRGWDRDRDRERYPVWDSFKDEYYYPDTYEDRHLGHGLDYDSQAEEKPSHDRPLDSGNKNGILQSNPDKPKVTEPTTTTHKTTVKVEVQTTPATPKPEAPRPTDIKQQASSDTDKADISNTDFQVSVDRDQTVKQEPVSSEQESGDKSVDVSFSVKSNDTVEKSDKQDGGFLDILNADAVEVESYTDSSQGPIVALALGLAITMILLIFVGCRLRTVKRRLRKGRALHSNEADYLINGMYL